MIEGEGEEEEEGDDKGEERMSERKTKAFRGCSIFQQLIR